MQGCWESNPGTRLEMK